MLPNLTLLIQRNTFFLHLPGAIPRSILSLALLLQPFHSSHAVMVLEDFEPYASLKVLGAHNNRWRAWIDFAHAQLEKRKLLGANFKDGSRSQPLSEIVCNILAYFPGDFPHAATQKEWHERQLKRLVLYVNNQAKKPVKTEQSLAQTHSDLTTRSNHTVQAVNSVTPAPAPLTPAPLSVPSAPPYFASDSPGITPIPLTVSSSLNRMISQVSIEVTRGMPGGSPRRHYSLRGLRNDNCNCNENEMSAEDTSLNTLRAFLLDDGIAESDADILCYGSLETPFDVTLNRHFHEALKFMYHRGDVVMSFWITAAARSIPSATARLVESKPSEPQRSRLQGNDAPVSIPPSIDSSSTARHERQTLEEEDNDLGQSSSTHLRIVMLTLAYLGLGALTGQGAIQHPSQSHDSPHAPLTFSINDRLALPTGKQDPSVYLISSDEEAPPAKRRKTRNC